MIIFFFNFCKGFPPHNLMFRISQISLGQFAYSSGFFMNSSPIFIICLAQPAYIQFVGTFVIFAFLDWHLIFYRRCAGVTKLEGCVRQMGWVVFFRLELGSVFDALPGSCGFPPPIFNLWLEAGLPGFAPSCFWKEAKGGTGWFIQWKQGLYFLIWTSVVAFPCRPFILVSTTQQPAFKVQTSPLFCILTPCLQLNHRHQML